MTAALTEAVSAAGVHSDEFPGAIARINSLDQSQVTVLLSGIIRQQLENLHPDGLDGEDVQDALTAAVRASSWYADVQPAAMGEVLLSALGVLAPEDATATGAYLTHAVLVIAALLPGQPMSITELSAGQLAEIRRAETMEMP